MRGAKNMPAAVRSRTTCDDHDDRQYRPQEFRPAGSTAAPGVGPPRLILCQKSSFCGWWCVVREQIVLHPPTPLGGFGVREPESTTYKKRVINHIYCPTEEKVGQNSLLLLYHLSHADFSRIFCVYVDRNKQ